MPSNTYADSAEKFLLDFFYAEGERELKSEIERILCTHPAWDVNYNLNPQRRHLLDWYPFTKNATLLDIGAGTGAVTGLFVDKIKKVTAVELTKRRAQILRSRFQDRDNLEVLDRNFEQYEPREKFDYVNMTGVLEYAGMFSDDPETTFANAHEKILKKCYRWLKPGGVLFVAIENPLGLRYFTGAVEDHYGELYEGVENYPQYNGIRTYTRTELEQLLKRAGFKQTKLYLPLPDYKLPTLVVAENFLNQNTEIALSAIYQNMDPAHPLFQFYAEVMLASQIQKEKLLSTFSNSFLFLAYK